MDNLISADSGANKHYKHSGFSSTITDSYSSPSTFPHGITWDGRYAGGPATVVQDLIGCGIISFAR